MGYDSDKIDDYTLALLHLVVWERKEGFGARAWKGFDWGTIDRLHEEGYIGDPKNKAKSVVMTEKGCSKAEALFDEFCSWVLYDNSGESPQLIDEGENR